MPDEKTSYTVPNPVPLEDLRRLFEKEPGYEDLKAERDALREQFVLLQRAYIMLKLEKGGLALSQEAFDLLGPTMDIAKLAEEFERQSVSMQALTETRANETLRTQFDAMREEYQNVQKLLDVQRTRVHEATQLWREETSEHLVQPDLGKLVTWLIERGSKALQENADIELQLTTVREHALSLMKLYPQGSPESKAFSALFANGAPSSRVVNDFYARQELLKGAIRSHAGQLEDDRCWLDDERLYGAAGVDVDEYDSTLPPLGEFLGHCARFHASRQHPTHKYTTVSEKIHGVFDKVLQIVKAQTYYPDTNVGMRQQWVKDQIAAAIEKLKETYA